jgi:hypothetical protein
VRPLIAPAPTSNVHKFLAKLRQLKDKHWSPSHLPISMNRIALAVGVVTASTLLIALPSHASGHRLMVQVSTAYANQCRLIIARDFDALNETMSPDFVNIYPDGTKIGRSQIIETLKRLPTIYKSCVTHVVAVSTNGKAIEAKINQRIDGIIRRGGENMRTVSTSSDKDTWRSYNGTLIETASRILEGRTTVNRKLTQQLGRHS